jgi:hypothetical protein
VRKGAQALLDAAPEAQAAFEQNRVLERIGEKRGDDRPPLARDRHELGDARLDDRRGLGASPAGRIREPLDPLVQLEKVPLVQHEAGAVFVEHQRAGRSQKT